MPHDLYASRPASAAGPSVLSLSLKHPFGRAALTVGLCAVVAAGLGLTVPGIIVVAAACASAGSNVRRGFLDLSQGLPNRAADVPQPEALAAPSRASGPAARAADSGAGLAAAVAVVGAAAAVGLVLAFYVPGILGDGRGLDDVLVLLALPAVAMAVPFALLAFIRVRLVLLIAGGVLAWTLIGAAMELFRGPPDGEGESLIVFAVVIVLNFVTAVTALVVNMTYRAATRSARRS